MLLYRRSYGVPYPNFTWHMDENHKLVRYVCACISIIFVLLQQLHVHTLYYTCSTNN